MSSANASFLLAIHARAIIISKSERASRDFVLSQIESKAN